MQDEGCAAVCRWMEARRQPLSITAITPLQELSLAYNHIGTTGILALADTLLRLQREDGGTANVNNSNNHTLISTLNLSGNAFTTEDVVNLIHALIRSTETTTSSSSVVSRLNLEDCSLEDDAMLPFAQALSQLTPGLVSLNISGHVVSKAIGNVFVQALQSPSCSSLVDLQLDLQEEDQQSLVDFYLRLHRGGRYLIRLSHYDGSQLLSEDRGEEYVEHHEEDYNAIGAAPNTPPTKSMPCSLWPFVFARLSKEQVQNEVHCGAGDVTSSVPSTRSNRIVTTTTNRSGSNQVDVLYYMMREKLDLIQPPPRLSVLLEDGDNEIENLIDDEDDDGLSPNSRRKRKRSLRT
jgi:hypothetical protein